MATTMPDPVPADSPFKAGVRVLPETQVLLAGQDLLTGLSSRAGLEAQFKLAAARARRYGTRFAVGLVVVDVERELADGALGGHDPVVVDAARRVRATLRETDVVARLGETRFAFLAEEIEETGAAAIAGRVAEAIAAAVSPSSDRTRPAVGIAFWQRDEKSLASLLREAEDALLEARKRGGYPWSDHEAEQVVPGGQSVVVARPRPARARGVARRLFGWVSLAALLGLASAALPDEWRARWLPSEAAVEQAWAQAQSQARRLIEDIQQRLPPAR
jgi:diguanylate cyclase (GGDEF)-like protein